MINFKSYSKEWQDFFVATVTDKKTNGTYLEIGAGWPVHASNTYLLETVLNWQGVGVEWDQELINDHLRERTNPCVCADATKIDYTKLLGQHNLGPHVDYLQLDIDPHDTLLALKQINFEKCSFSIITYEHDYYADPENHDRLRHQSREFLKDRGYTIVITDVIPPNQSLSHEDWYINEKYMTSDTWKLFVGNNISMHNDSWLMDQRYYQLFKDHLNYDQSN